MKTGYKIIKQTVKKSAAIGCICLLSLIGGLGVITLPSLITGTMVAAPDTRSPLTAQPSTICASGTNRVLFATTNTVGFGAGGADKTAGPLGRADCTAGKELGLDFEFAQSVAGTTNFFTFVFAKGLTFGGSTNYATTDTQTFTIQGNGTNIVRYVTNFTILGVSDYYLIAIRNTNDLSTSLTNILVKANNK